MREFILGLVLLGGAAGLSCIDYAAQPSSPPAQDGQGPYFHQVLSASSPDGLNWTFDDILLLDHASVPASVVTPEGNIRIYYVDASRAPENTNCAESTDGGESFSVLGCTIAGMTASKALDPSIVLLEDGRYRLYFYGSAPGDPGTFIEHSIFSAISEDGIHFTEEARVFSYPGLVDPDVFWNGNEWLMFVFALNQGTIVARSADGLSFEYVGLLDPQHWGTTAPVRLSDGALRLYAFNQPQGNVVASFLSTDGLAWIQEEGVRLAASQGYHITDPFVVQLPDGTWKMVYKTGKNPTNQPSTSNDAPSMPPCTNTEISLSNPTALPLLARAQAKSPERYRFALEKGAKAYPTSDGQSFVLWWLPPPASAQTPPLIVTLHGSLSYAFDEFFLWYPYALARGYGILALQWWLGGDETHLETEDYYAPNQVYPILECALRSQGVPTERSLLHGFSRGSANIYAVTALDRDTGNDFFKLIVANAGGASSDFPENIAIENGEFGSMPFEGTHWAMFCGGRDPNPDRDGCPAMHRTQDWVSDLGGAVELFIEDPDADHGGFHHTPAHANAALDVFSQLLAGP